MLEKVINIVKDASKIMNASSFNTYQKGNDSNFVTSKDLEIEEYLTNKLTSLLPNSYVHGEENKDIADLKKPCWIIDPIDGTSNFIRDLKLSVISVGLIIDSEMELGVIYFPYNDEVYYAQKGKGAFLNGKPIHVSNRDFKHSHLCAGMSIYDKKYAHDCFKVIEHTYNECDDLRRLGAAALELVYLACGKIELFFEIHIFAWDVAAGLLIIKEAGGYACDFDYKKLYEDEPFLFFAANTKENLDKFSSIITEELSV